ncbi:hypothetical protein ABT294_41045 [Nonomuraea sp. NPDC000554]|uniref:hypothetical protein n=1 Tax=Nonomuraea sp. NPDC000554 TaxID=3154259 RepID=UPI00332E4C70
MAVAMTGCGAGCRTEADQQIHDLKQIVPKLLPESVAATLEEGNDCDSGEGGHLSFTADPATDSEKLVEKFLSQGWKRIDREKENMGPRFIDGVTTERDGKVVNITIGKSDDGSEMDILAEFQS